MLRHRLVLVGSLQSVGAMVLAVVAVALDYWLVQANPKPVGVKMYMGLWEVCSKVTAQVGQALKTEKKCYCVSDMEELNPQKDFAWMKGCEATMVLAIINLGVALFVPFVLAIPQRPLVDKATARKLAAGLILIGGILCFITVIVFGAKAKDIFVDMQVTMKFHAGFVLAIVAGILCIISSVLLTLAKDEPMD